MTTPPQKHPAQRTTGATWLAWACAAVLGLSSLPVGAHIELKASFVALAVGNTAYEHIGSDSSGENDAEAVAAPPAGEQFRDCADCPEMVVIPAGRFEMGCDTEDCDDDEKPVHEVQIRDDFALGRYEVTVGEFRRFAEAKGYRSDAEQDAGRGCWEVLMGRESGWTPGRSWRNLEYAAEDREPVTCVSWNDAQAYAAWLGERTGAGYRLPSEAEWEYAAGPGTGTKYQFENDRETLCRFSNLAEPTKLLPNTLLGCVYGVPYPAAVGSYRPNAFGLYDMHGNVWEWAEDCWNRSYAGAPTDGSAWLSGDCGQRVVRGGLWSFLPRLLRGGNRYGDNARYRSIGSGFRVARTLDPQVDASATPHERQ